MKPTLVCLFAHPDDEAFGPSGTIHTFTKTHDVYIICATNGDAGENHHPDGDAIDLGEQRQKEIKDSSAVLGVKKVFFLNHGDGQLNNNIYHQVADECKIILNDLKPEILMSFEHRGISGHLDHVFMAMVTSFLYQKLDYVKQAFFYCMSEEQRNAYDYDYFIFFPPGYRSDQIDKMCDVCDCMDKKREAISKHISQTKDMSRILSTLRDKECFYVYDKVHKRKVSSA